MLGRAWAILIAGSLLVGLASGCGSQADERAIVRGQVRFAGHALSGGFIVFTPDPDRGTATELAISPIQSDGFYQLQTDKGLGIPPGWYRISIGPASTALPFPEKYRDPLRSGLTCEIHPGRENVVDFNLE